MTSRTVRPRRTLIVLVASVLALVTSVSAAQGAVHSAPGATSRHSARASLTVLYPQGTPDSSEPSGYAPPSANAMANYTQTYVNDFEGSSIPATWNVFSGTPGGDPSGLWATSHVVVSGGMLQLNTSQDPSDANAWVSGGVCQCGITRTYGAYFVRSRVTGSGPSQVELLWPAQGWPPEIDFNEMNGVDTGTTATLHYDANNDQLHNSLKLDMSEWHTWGVVWTPTSIIYTVDGQVWGTVTDAAAIPSVPMELDITQQTFCGASPVWACPTSPESLDVDWVAEYSPGAASTTTTTTTTATTASSFRLGPFRTGSTSVGAVLGAQIRRLARTVKQGHDREVRLVGYGDTGEKPTSRLATGLARAAAVKRRLLRELEANGVTGVRVAVRASAGRSVSTPLTSPLVVVHAVVVASLT